ncbi:MAG: ABC transporter ATP-binding protein [Candidatus Omnitrophica bacterium]|nr:ABC transporter ATP-binding protein [Candidatus Omnitrophota bacterium]
MINKIKQSIKIAVKKRISGLRIYGKINSFMQLYNIVNPAPGYITIQIAASFLIAFFDSLSVGLLVPLAKGIIEMDFSFLNTAPFFSLIVKCFPGIFSKAPAKLMFVTLVTVIFIVAVTKNILEYTFDLVKARHRMFYLFRVRRIMLERYLTFGKEYFDKTSTGTIFATINFAVHSVDLIDLLIGLLKIVFTLMLYIGIMIFISWKLSIFIALTFPVMHFALNRVIKMIKETSKLQTESTIKLHHQLVDIFGSIPLIKAYNKEKEVERRYTNIADSLRRILFSMSKKTLFIRPMQEVIMLVSLLALISTAAFLFMKNRAGGVSGFLVFFYLVRRCNPLINIFSMARGELAEKKIPAKVLLQLFDDKDKYFVSEGEKIFGGLKEKIEFRHLNFSYTKDIGVLQDLSLEIKRGNMTAIVGPSGVGKTTIVNLLLRFYDCPPGTIFVDGTDIKKFRIASLRDHIASVSQDTFIFNDTIKNNIVFAVDSEPSEAKLIEVAKKSRLHDFITKLPDGFDTIVGDRGLKLSGGEKQRLSIARALLKGSEILILDEATSSLDTYTERLIHEAIEEVTRGRTTIVIAHRLSTIKNADKIAVIENGSVIEVGVLSELLAKKGKFYQYWEEQKFY